MLDPTKISIRASTQEHLDVEDIQNDLVILKDGSVCLILQTTAVNFGLLSEQEQDATIYAYAGLLNSLTFPIQIVIKSQRKDITSYLKLLRNEEDKQKNSLLKERIRSYRIFIESMVRENNVLDKKFYLVIPFSAIELGVKGASGIFNKGLPYPKSYILEKAKTSLFPKRDHLIRQFNRIGLKISQLNTKQLIELFFKTYNPESIGTQQIGNAMEYTTSIVEAAIEPGGGIQTNTNQNSVKKQMPPSPEIQIPPSPISATRTNDISNAQFLKAEAQPISPVSAPDNIAVPQNQSTPPMPEPVIKTQPVEIAGNTINIPNPVIPQPEISIPSPSVSPTGGASPNFSPPETVVPPQNNNQVSEIVPETSSVSDPTTLWKAEEASSTISKNDLNNPSSNKP